LLMTREFLFGRRVICNQPIVLDEFLFGEQPVLDVMPILPTTHFVEVVCKPCYLRSGWPFAAGVCGQPFFARETRKKIRDSHGRILVRFIGVGVTSRGPESEHLVLHHGSEPAVARFTSH